MIQDKLYPTLISQEEGTETTETPDNETGGETQMPEQGETQEGGEESPAPQMPEEDGVTEGGEEETPAPEAGEEETEEE